MPAACGNGAAVPDLVLAAKGVGASDLLRETLLQCHVPVSLLVDRKLKLHGVEGPVDRYRPRTTDTAGGAWSILGCGDLRNVLRKAVREAANGAEVEASAVLSCADGDRLVGLRVVPSDGARHARGLFLVTLLDPDVAGGMTPGDGAREPAVLNLAGELAAAIDSIALLESQLSMAEEKIQNLDEELFQVDDEYRAACGRFEIAQARLEADNQALLDANRASQEKIHALERQANDLDNLLNSTDVATLFLDVDLCIRWYTPATTALIPLRPWDLGRHAGQLEPRFSGRDLALDAAAVLLTLEPSVTEVRGADGRWHIRRIMPYRTRDDHIEGVAVTFADITERKRSEDEIIHQATHDSLTGLPNRATFHRELALARERASAANGRLAVLMLDLDRFKRVNDSYGHAVGDLLLVETARRLRRCARGRSGRTLGGRRIRASDP